MIKLIPKSKERWKNIPGFKGRYQASTYGNLRSKRSKRLYVSPRCNDDYLRVKLMKDGSPVERLVHQLILLTFVGPRPDEMMTRHLDGNPQNNKLSNLRYGTRLENARDMVKHGRSTRGTKNRHAKLEERDIYTIRAWYKSGVSVVELCYMFKISQSHMYRILSGAAWGWLNGNESRLIPKVKYARKNRAAG